VTRLTSCYNHFARQLWRLVTAFLYFGPVTLDLAFHLFFMLVRNCHSIESLKSDVSRAICSMRYSRLLEENNFAGRRADYLCLLLFNGIILLVGRSGFKGEGSAEQTGFSAGHIAPLDLTISLRLSCLLAGLYLVETKPISETEHIRTRKVSHRRRNRTVMGQTDHGLLSTVSRPHTSLSS
jgi:hypothetical protein